MKNISLKIFRKNRHLALLLSLIISILLVVSYFHGHSKVRYDKLPDSTFFQRNVRVKRHILKALRFTHNNAVKVELLQALSHISNDIEKDRYDIKFSRIHQMEQQNRLRDVCLEEFKGVIDHPLYNQGQIEIKCNKKPFEDVLTFVVVAKSCYEMINIIEGIQNIYNKSKIIIGSPLEDECKQFVGKNVENIEIVKYGKDWLKVIEKVKTEYVLFAPNIYHFDNQSKIERLVQMVSYTDVKIAAGGLRLEDGKFSTGCYQMAMKMYTLKLVAGYDMSFNSCLYCDYSPAPFVTRTSYLIDQLKSKSESLNNIFMLEIFTDLMISKQDQILVCPDVMFHVKPYDLSSIERKQWLPYVSKFELNRLMFADGKDMNFTCSESSMSCYKEKGLMVPLCCLKELSDSLKFMKKILDAQNVTFEVLEGTVMGGLKYGNILFWERDADTNFRVQMIDKLEDRIGDIKNQGYSMQMSYECPFKKDHEKCRLAGWHGSIYFAYRTPNWRTEMYGVTFILSDFRGKLKKPTKINIDGEWYITYTNPALYGRNIYGGDIFQHIEHYSALGISHTKYAELYAGSFAKCPRPGFHGCLDNFVGEGNLQFLYLFV